MPIEPLPEKYIMRAHDSSGHALYINDHVRFLQRDSTAYRHDLVGTLGLIHSFLYVGGSIRAFVFFDYKFKERKKECVYWETRHLRFEPPLEELKSTPADERRMEVLDELSEEYTKLYKEKKAFMRAYRAKREELRIRSEILHRNAYIEPLGPPF
jgi:hypothetical protein